MPARRGYTFVELLLVLAILAALAAMAWPAVVRFSGEQAIKDASERVRSELDRTRFRSINAGVAYQFRYEPNGRRFVAVPAERDVSADPAASTPTAQAAQAPPSASGQIREGLTFQPTAGTASASAPLAADWLTGLPDAVLLGQSQWSSPIYFHPDGTGTTARFRILDDKQRFIEVSVRDLTGMAAAGPLRKEANKWE